MNNLTVVAKKNEFRLILVSAVMQRTYFALGTLILSIALLQSFRSHSKLIIS